LPYFTGNSHASPPSTAAIARALSLLFVAWRSS
jgi:hypothetical protein